MAGLHALCRRLAQMPELQDLLQQMEQGGCPTALTGPGTVHRAQIAAAVALQSGRPITMVCGEEKEAERLCGDLSVLLGKPVVYLTARELRLRSAAASRDWERRRLSALHTLQQEGADIIVATADALLQRTLPPQLLRESTRCLRIGDRVDLDALCLALTQAGYQAAVQVEGAGQFARRGGILDVFSPQMEQPVRMEFFDDELDAMGVFDAGSQRRLRNLEQTVLLPAAEVLPDFAPNGRTGLAQALRLVAQRQEKKDASAPLVQTLREDAAALEAGTLSCADRYLGAIYPEQVTAADYLPVDSAVFLCDSVRVSERVKSFLLEHKEDLEVLLENGCVAGEFARYTLSAEELWQRLTDFPLILSDTLPLSRYPVPPRSLLSIPVKQLSSYGGSIETAAADLEQYRSAGYAVLVLCGGETRCRNLLRLLEERGISASLDLAGEGMPQAGEVRLSVGALSFGAEYPRLRLAILTEGQLERSPRPVRRVRREEGSNRRRLQSYQDLTPGDLVVHAQHGIGRFVSLERMIVDGAERDYIKIAYAGSDTLYVPATQLDLVSKYIGSSGADGQPSAKLSRLGGQEWSRTKTKAKAAAKELAKGLIQLYAERQRRPGFAFSPDSPWQKEFEDAFGYVETDEQLRCIAEIKADMERPVPMDRLLCGDVGFGKTEVALRAVMKCVLDGKQAAILVPTTVLAQQHFATALGRFRGFPVEIQLLSRFRTPQQRKQILSDTAAGRVDVLIGTHSLLQKGLRFKDLGLIVVDEEQRFGVSHKEKLKELSKQVDVLTLSATPIPRTLNMALSGIRDMSTLDAPPADRQPVQTYVMEHDWGVLADAMRRELARGGQVFYLHNRTDTIDRCAARIQAILGDDVRVAIAHGQMNEQQLSEVMDRMTEGEADVLVCTTIIETGIDLPNVNTLIVEDADRLGLAQLHQLRGRIGRSARRASAYMTYRAGKTLTEEANRRLTAIREYVEFGSGFKIAMRDLEIRGAGNLLGAEQSGSMMSVGYDMYLKLIEEAVLEEQGKAPRKPAECVVDLQISANIPTGYVSDGGARMDLYRRIAGLRQESDFDDLLDELFDRYGEPPQAVYRLLDVTRLRIAAANVGVKDVSHRGERVIFTFSEVPVEAVMKVCSRSKYRNQLLLSAGETATMTLRLKKGVSVLDQTIALLEELRLAQQEEDRQEGER